MLSFCSEGHILSTHKDYNKHRKDSKQTSISTNSSVLVFRNETKQINWSEVQMIFGFKYSKPTIFCLFNKISINISITL